MTIYGDVWRKVHGTVTGKWHYNKFPDAKEILRGVNISI